jgi:hypothetical protein
MTTQVLGTVANGMVRIDVPIALPENTPVQITIEQVGPGGKTPRQALADFLKSAIDDPVYGDGEKFNRDALYDRY